MKNQKKEKTILKILIILIIILSSIAFTKNDSSVDLVESVKIEDIERSTDALKRLGYMSVDEFDTFAEGVLQGKAYVQVLKDSFDLMDTATLKPDIVEAHFSVAVFLNILRKTDEAIKQYEYLLTISPKHSLALDNLAKIYLDRGEYEKTENYYKQIIKANPSFSQSYMDLADVYRAFIPEKKSEIPQIIEGALKERPEGTNLMLYLAEFYEQEKEYDLSIEWYQKVLSINSDTEVAKQAIEFIENKL